MTLDLRIEKLRREHAVEDFRCGEAALDRFLIRHALQAQQAHSSQTYVALANATVVGYHTIVASEAVPETAPARVSKGMPRHPIPLLVLARLAVHSGMQGRGLGAGLLLDAMRRTLQVADIVGVRALAVHAKDETAAAFYQHFGFTRSPTDPRHFYLLIKDIRAAVGGG